ncbi:MAG: thioredoxin domain-containing protein [Desulfobacterales bacterium]|nr:thioredoxin domain-containing protein [Desulfobacterales bacterium]
MNKRKNGGKVRSVICFFIFLSVSGLFSLGWAEVEWRVQKTLELTHSPVDVAVSRSGKWIFVLTEAGELFVYSSQGVLNDTIVVGSNVNRIQEGPEEHLLLLTDRKNNTVKVLALEFIQLINIEGSPVRGEENAPVTIVLFAEFQCPYCARMAPLLKQVLAQNKGKVKLVFKHFPLKMHKFALVAAAASEVAANTGEFWEFHDRLFDEYDSLSDEKILTIAADLGFDRAEFEEKMKAPDLFRRIQADINDGLQADVKGVPKVFINGRQLTERTLDGFQKLIDAELKKTAH